MPIILVQMSEKKLGSIRAWLNVQGMTGHLMPEHDPVQQLALAVMLGIDRGEDHVRLREEVDELSCVES